MTSLALNDPGLMQPACLIDGEWRSALDRRTTDIRNPATGDWLAAVPFAGAQETEDAVRAAERALPMWRGMTAEARAKILKRWFDLMMTHQEDLALILTSEQGKPMAEARGEIAYSASFLEWFAEEARRVYGEVIPSPWPDKRLVVTHTPVGVCAAITPWNFPSAMITRKVGPALAAGCTIIIKPAPQTPLSAFAMGVLALRAGVPPGVLNIISGDAQAIGGVLTTSPVVRKLSFTGSTAVGRLLAQQCGATLKRVSLELGGNAPFIVFDDADVDAAVEGAMISKYRNSGQTCVCANRLFVQSGIYERFSQKLAEAVSTLKVGVGLEVGVQQGPLIDQAALSKVSRLVQDAREKGARVLTGGRPHARGGTFYEPTLLADVTTDMRVAHEEIFGPVAPIFKFHTEDEAIRLANETDRGLAAYFYTRDVGRAWRVGEAINSGMVGLNTGIISTTVAPFGGVNQSGIGREGGRQGILEYLDVKYLCMGGV